MWLRIALYYDIGFLPETLNAYRHHQSSSTADVARASLDWLDQLWVLERLLCENLDDADRRVVRSQRRLQVRRVLRGQAGRILRGDRKLGSLLEYGHYRLKRANGRATRFYQPCPPAPA